MKYVRYMSIAVATAVACGGLLASVSVAGGSTSRASDQPIKVGMIAKVAGAPYFTATEDGAKSVANSLKIQLTFEAPATSSGAAQVPLVQSFTTQRYNVIGVCADDPTTPAPAMRAAMAKGIKVFSWDADVTPTARSFYVEDSTPQGIGSTFAGLVGKHAAGRVVDLAFLNENPTVADQAAYISETELFLHQKYPNVKVVAHIYDDGNPALAISNTEALLRANPKITAIVSPDSAGLPGAAKAVSDLGLTGKVYVTGLADPIVMKSAVKSGVVTNYVLWNEVLAGKLDMYLARGMVDGTVPGNGTWKTPVGSFSVHNRTILLGPPFVFTPQDTATMNW